MAKSPFDSADLCRRARSRRSRIKRQVSDCNQGGHNDAKAALLKGDGPARQADDAEETLERAASDADLNPDNVSYRVSRRDRVAERHGGEDAAPQANEVTDGGREVLEVECHFDLARSEDQNGAQKK